MKSKPIIFSEPMVKAILSGTKTQTRRIIRIQPQKDAMGISLAKELGKGDKNRFGCIIQKSDGLVDFAKCPYGEVGDLLYVRERWTRGKIAVGELPDGRDSEPYVSQCTGENNIIYYQQCIENDVDTSECTWKPSIYMPKSASRIFLKVTGVRIERLNDINASEAIKEGIEPILNAYTNYQNPQFPTKSPIQSFRSLWEKIHGGASWNYNPWVWVVEFELQKPLIR